MILNSPETHSDELKAQPKFIAFESVMPEQRHTRMTVPQCDEEACPCNSDL